MSEVSRARRESARASALYASKSFGFFSINFVACAMLRSAGESLVSAGVPEPWANPAIVLRPNSRSAAISFMIFLSLRLRNLLRKISWPLFASGHEAELLHGADIIGLAGATFLSGA